MGKGSCMQLCLWFSALGFTPIKMPDYGRLIYLWGGACAIALSACVVVFGC